MNRFNIDERQQAIRNQVAEFAKKYIEPVSKELDHRDDPDRFALDIYKQLGKEGFIGLNSPKELGGGGMSNIEYITLIEELCYHDPAICLLNAVGELATYPIVHFGSDEQKKKYVPKCVSGEIIPSFVLTEPDAGSDAANQKTTAVLDGDEYVINGEKIFIMHGDVADLFVLFLKIQEKEVADAKASRKVSAIIVEARKDGKLIDGIKTATLKKKMGMRAATTGRIWFDNLRVPKENLLSEQGKGFRIAMNTLDSARIGVAAQAVGIAQRALDESIAYSKKRVCFGSPISKFQATQWKIADMSTQVEAARLMAYKAAQMKDAGVRYSLEAAQAKLFCTEVSNFCVNHAMQIHGGYGYIGEFSPIEKLYRDQRVIEIYEGTSEVQRLVIAGMLLR
ncbi:MAG: acyl-CoA dehydrogenase family protein [candidate division Zixibacteria bacterium]|nr:acyl-CoA dehydrogenase family protein [candidate division Zixibacteria bacterium]